MRICSKCKQEKTDSDFYKVKAGRVKTWCKDCERAYQKELYAKDPERVKRRSQNWREKYKEKYSEVKKRNRRTGYIYELRSKYGLSKEYAEKLIEEKGKNCEICGVDFDNKIPLRRRNFDHCHKTGDPGSFICSRCNTVLGLINDDKSLTVKISKYIERYRRCISS